MSLSACLHSELSSNGARPVRMRLGDRALLIVERRASNRWRGVLIVAGIRVAGLAATSFAGLHAAAIAYARAVALGATQAALLERQGSLR